MVGQMIWNIRVGLRDTEQAGDVTCTMRDLPRKRLMEFACSFPAIPRTILKLNKRRFTTTNLKIEIITLESFLWNRKEPLIAFCILITWRGEGFRDAAEQNGVKAQYNLSYYPSRTQANHDALFTLLWQHFQADA